jgi:hypothetical protein
VYLPFPWRVFFLRLPGIAFETTFLAMIASSCYCRYGGESDSSSYFTLSSFDSLLCVFSGTSS